MSSPNVVMSLNFKDPRRAPEKLIFVPGQLALVPGVGDVFRPPMGAYEGMFQVSARALNYASSGTAVDVELILKEL